LTDASNPAYQFLIFSITWYFVSSFTSNTSAKHDTAFVTTLSGSSSANPLFTYFWDNTDSAGGGKIRIITDINGQIKQTPDVLPPAEGSYRIVTLGWKDWRMT